MPIATAWPRGDDRAMASVRDQASQPRTRDMTSHHDRGPALALATASPSHGAPREIDYAAVQHASRELLRALGADVDAEALAGDAAPHGRRLRRAAHAAAVPGDDVPQRRRLRRADRRARRSRSTRCACITCCRSTAWRTSGTCPGERIIGLSKLGRVVELFARDLQIQERLTTQIAGWLQRELEPKGVGVVLEAEHMCMSLRGVQKLGAKTVTSALHGLVRDDARTRQEFLALTTRTAHDQ